MEDHQYSFSGLEIGDFLTASLLAVSNAQNSMSKAQVNAIIESCFIKKGRSGFEPVMLTLELTRSVVVPDESGKNNIEQIKTNFNVPLITLFPLTALGIDSVKLDFGLEITNQYQEEKTTSSLTKDNGTNKKVNLMGKISSQNNSNSDDGKSSETNKSSSNFTMHIEARPLPLSPGLLSIIDLYTNAIQPLGKNPNEQ